MLILVLGSVAAGAWASRPVSSLVFSALSSSPERNGAGPVTRAVFLANAPHLFGAAVAGLVLGMVAEGRRARWWLVLFVVAWILWMLSPVIGTSHHVRIPMLLGMVLQALIGCVVAGVTFWLVRRLRGPEPVA